MCIHSNCSNNKTQQNEAKENPNSLCKFHQNELDGQSKWICSWCEEFKKKYPGTCDLCYKRTNEANELDTGDYACDDCYSTLIDRAEYAYESQKEAGLI